MLGISARSHGHLQTVQSLCQGHANGGVRYHAVFVQTGAEYGNTDARTLDKARRHGHQDLTQGLLRMSRTRRRIEYRHQLVNQ